MGSHHVALCLHRLVRKEMIWATRCSREKEFSLTLARFAQLTGWLSFRQGDLPLENSEKENALSE